MEFKIVPPEKATALRKTFIQKFVNTTSDHYQKHISTLIQYTDGLYYDGYLWECLQGNDKYQLECSMDVAADFLKDKKNVFVMWDLFSKERVNDNKYFSLDYPKDTIISMQGDLLGQQVVTEWHTEQSAWRKNCQPQNLWLPEDIYCFDECMDWYVIFTHEGWDSLTNPELDEDAYIRICFLHTRTQ